MKLTYMRTFPCQCLMFYKSVPSGNVRNSQRTVIMYCTISDHYNKLAHHQFVYLQSGFQLDSAHEHLGGHYNVAIY